MNKKAGFDFWQALIWIGAIVILGWALLKSFGVISSPIWIQMLPYYGVGVTLLGVAYGFGKLMRDVEGTNKKVNQLSRDFNGMREDFIKVKHNQVLCMNGKLSHSPFRKRVF